MFVCEPNSQALCPYTCCAPRGNTQTRCCIPPSEMQCLSVPPHALVSVSDNLYRYAIFVAARRVRYHNHRLSPHLCSPTGADRVVSRVQCGRESSHKVATVRQFSANSHSTLSCRQPSRVAELATHSSAVPPLGATLCPQPPLR